MKAKIVSFQKGFQEFEDVSLVRLKSPQVNLLIMEDHLPILGDITGTVEIVSKDEHTVYENIDGYYMHKKNVFELVLKE